MLSKEENDFLIYWENNRDAKKNFLAQIGYGLPKGLLFALPVLVLVIFDDWYKNMIPLSKTQIVIIIIAVVGIAIFYAMFRMKFNWDHNEQLYKELKFKKSKEEASNS